MARTIREIYDAMAITKSENPELFELEPNIDTSQALLSELTTTSRVARWRVFMWVMAVCMWAHEKLWDKAKAELLAIAASSHVGTLRWYVEKARQYQHGYPLVIINNVPAYATDEPAARIVTRAAGKEGSGQVLLKVAKTSGTDLVPLSAGELTAFEAYVDAVKMAGTVVQVISDVADLVKVQMTVYYDPLVMAPDGTLLLLPSTKPVEDAIRSYIANLPFNGAMVLTSIVDVCQQAVGVVNPVLGTVHAKYGLFPYTQVSVQYVANAGHIVVDPANDLDTTITYLPYVV